MNELAALRLFCRVVERGSFSAVGRELGLSQPSVSRRIADLEAHLGVQLLTRTTRKVAPTAAGRGYYDRVRGALRTLSEARTELSSGVGEVAGSVRVAAPAAFGRQFVLPVLVDLMGKHAGLQVQLLLSDSSVDLIGEAIDIAVRIATVAPQSFRQRRIGNARQVVVASSEYLRSSAAGLRPEHAGEHCWVLAHTTLAAIEQLRGTPDFAAIPTIRPRFLCDDIEAVSSAVRAHIGVSVLPLWMVSDDLRNGTLIQLMPELPLPAAPVVALYAPTPVVPSRIRTVLDGLALQVAADPATC
ncbi:MAG: LysR family transcriptional regulator [Polyangiaceae bacterium]|nr:LysR family transcriptional regulator [Polyangiaceae bacterium]